MQRSIPAISAILVLLTALAGCADDPKPIEPSGSATGIPVPTLPEQATENSPSGRAAFLAHWMDLVNYTAITGDTAPLLAASKGCAECAELADTTAQVRYHGKRVAENIWHVKRIEMVNSDATRFTIYIGPNPELEVDPLDLGVILPAEPPFHVVDIGRLE